MSSPILRFLVLIKIPSTLRFVESDRLLCLMWRSFRFSKGSVWKLVHNSSDEFRWFEHFTLWSVPRKGQEIEIIEIWYIYIYCHKLILKKYIYVNKFGIKLIFFRLIDKYISKYAYILHLNFRFLINMNNNNNWNFLFLY